MRVKSFSSKPRLSGWGFEVPDVEMSIPSVSGYLTIPYHDGEEGLARWLPNQLHAWSWGGSTSRGCSAHILVYLSQWRNANLSQCFGENQFSCYKVSCAVLFLSTSFLLLLLASRKTCKSLLSASPPEIRHFVLLGRLGHTFCNLLVCNLFNHLLSHALELQWVSPSM